MLIRHVAWIEVCAALIAVFLCARIVATSSAAALSPAPTLAPSIARNAAPAAAFPLDPERLARLFAIAPRVAEVPPSAVPATVQGTLAATAVTEPRRYSLCQIVTSDGARVLGLGETLDGARISAIEPRRVLFDNGAVLEMSPGAASAGMLLRRDELDGALAHLPELMTQARATPSFTNGVLDGFRLSAIAPGSLYARIGLQNGDVIRRINDSELTSAEAGLRLFEKLRNASRIEVELERRGERVRETYVIR